MNAEKQNERTILLTGFMGAGKTTVAHALARKLNRTALDLDALIVEREKRSIEGIIEAEGEAKFRSLETKALRDALGDEKLLVIALGGGAWTTETNRILIAEHNGFVVWLDAPFELCWQRIAADNLVARPLASARDAAQKLYDARRTFYQLAELHIKVSEEESAEDLADEIVKRAA